MYSTQKQLIKEQDDHLNEIGEIAARLHDHAKNIDKELEKQDGLIKQLGTDVDKTQTKMNFVQKKLSTLLKTSDSSQICTILILFVVLIILIFLTIYT